MIDFLLFLQQLLIAHCKHLRKGLQFNVRDESGTAFYPLNRILVQLDPFQLHPVCQKPLRHLGCQFLADPCNIIPGYVVFS